MSLNECTSALRTDGRISINAREFSQHDLEAAAAIARTEHARLVIYNLNGRSCEEVARIADAGGKQVTFGDLHLI